MLPGRRNKCRLKIKNRVRQNIFRVRLTPGAGVPRSLRPLAVPTTDRTGSKVFQAAGEHPQLQLGVMAMLQVPHLGAG